MMLLSLETKMSWPEALGISLLAGAAILGYLDYRWRG
jgi:hypothetical protein